jgi:arylsulfatase
VGWSDIGCYGGEIPTPHLDALAAGGLRFTQFYNTGRCCPTRASLLTGLYPHQAGIGHMMDDKSAQSGPGFEGDLNRRGLTIAEALKLAGYRAYALGKWHVTRHAKPQGPKHNWPLQRGFDRYYGTITGGGNYFDPAMLTRDNTPVAATADPEYRPEKFYYTDALSDNAARFVAEHRRDHADRPFFMFLAYTAAHWPLHAPDDEIARHHGKYDAGYEPVRRARWEKQRNLGLVDPRWAFPSAVGDWPGVDNKAWESRCMEVYAAQISRMDAGIGRLIEAIRQSGQLENTLVFYLQDNGACAENMRREADDRRAEKPTLPPLPKDHIFVDVRPKQTRDGWPMLGGRGVMPGPADTFLSYGAAWANVSNTPFRKYKHWVHEGGISTPLIVHWPEGIAARGGVRTQPAHLIDIMSTCLDVARVPYPAERGGQRLLPPEGRSLQPAFAGEPIDREALYWEHEGNRAVRVGDWKLVADGPGGPWELYDLGTDRTEMHDLASAQPDRVREMSALWETWARRANAIPWPWKPAYGEKPSARTAPAGR